MTSFGPRQSVLRALLVFLSLSVLSLHLAAAEPNRRMYDIPADSADRSLKRLAEQSDREVLFPSVAVEGVQTRAVRGTMTAAEAMRQMLAGTALAGIEDSGSGALTVTREAAAPQSTGARAAEAGPGRGANAVGIIQGRVSNSATGAYLTGALVYVEGTSSSAVTDREGAYTLQLPPGRYTLLVSYTGLNPQQQNIQVESGSRIPQDFDLTAEIYELARFVVAGEREGNAAAIMEQRMAPNVKNVVSMDAFGSLAGNPADLLEKIPGITVDRTGGDIRAVMVRGIDEGLNSVTMDGAKIANINTDRGFQFQNVGSDHIESIEVIKAPTPDMDGDAIGGTINLRTRSAFSLKGRRLSYSIGGVIGSERDHVHPSFAFTYSDVFSVRGGDQNLGISLSAGWRQHNAVIQRTTQNYNTANGFLFNLNVGYNFAAIRTRWGGGVKIDYKLSEDSSFFMNLTAAPHKENNQVKTAVFAGNQTVAPLNSQGQPTGGGSIMPGFSDTYTELRPVAGSNINLSQNAHPRRQAVSYTSQFGGKTRKSTYDLDYDVTYSYAQNKPFATIASASLPGVGMIFEKDTPQSYTPKVTITGGPDIFELDNYNFGSLSEQNQKHANEMIGGQFNYKRSFDLAVPADLKSGVKIRQQNMDRWNFASQWTHPGLALGQFEDLAFSNQPFDSRYPPLRFLSADAIEKHKNENPTLWTEHPTLQTQNILTGRQTLSERVSAAYIQGSTRISKLYILAGVRVERTDVKGEGSLQQITPEERARRAEWSGVVTPEEARRRVISEFGQRRTVKSDYQDVLPGVHFNYNFTSSTVGRASYTTGLARPNPGNLMPLDLINDESQTVRINNTGLQPQRGQNFNFSIEHYFEPAGLVSAGVFYKEINHFIYNTAGQLIGTGADNGFNGQYSGYTLNSQANGGFAQVKGLELSYQQQFTFLPGWLSGFGAFANYTKLETRGDYGSIGNVRSSGEIPGFVPEAANAGISYIRNKISIRLQYAYNSERLVAFNANPDQSRWELETHRVDLKTKYFMHRRLSLYLDVYNLYGDNQRERFGNGMARFLQDRYDPQFHFGVEGRF